MAIELHHLHPSHDDEVARLKARIAELERMDTEHTVQIAKMNAYIRELEEAQQIWIKTSDKLPNENQEVEFIAKRPLFKGDSGERMRFLGVYKQMFLNPQHCIFYASAPGWGSEFLPKEVEYWMPKITMPQPPEDGK